MSKINKYIFFKKICSKRGFSLIEIMVCIALSVIFASLIFANISFIHRYLLRAEVDKIFNVCRYLQRCAQISGEKKVLYFDIKNNIYMYDNKMCRLPKRIKFGTIPGVKGPPSSPRKIINSPITFKGNKVVFHPDGIIQSGTVYITDNKNRFLYAVSCSVSQVSYLRKYLYNQTWTQIK